MMINGPVNQKDTAVLNVYALNIRASTYMRWKPKITKKISRQIYGYSWKFQHCTFSYRTVDQKISKNCEEFNSTINQFDLIDIYRTLHNSRICLLFKCLWTLTVTASLGPGKGTKKMEKHAKAVLWTQQKWICDQ